MTENLRCISPVDGRIFVERPYATSTEIAAAVDSAVSAQAQWKRTSISERADICTKAIDAFVANKDEISNGITWQMGRPVRYGGGEVGGVEERARHMIAIAEKALEDRPAEQKDGFTRFIRRDPLGVVFVIAPWNYPYLTSINSIIPAIMAGNAVILKHSAQTPLCAEVYADAFAAAGLPKGVFQFLHLNHADTETLIKSPDVGFVAFTGSVPGGAMVEQAAAGRFVGVGLELGGKDPAYVRGDADVKYAAESLVDGAFFNSGQSCCGIERIYAHESVYDQFIDIARDTTLAYNLGDPTNPNVTIGPLVRASAADFVRKQTADAIAAGARAIIPDGTFGIDEPGSPYLGPQILVDVDHAMDVMSEESFGPVVGIMKVSSDEDAVRLMNDSAFGLTASIWTADADAALRIGDEVSTGTWFMNRCDYLDPALAWTGVKDSGRGCTLSPLGYDHLTRPKSFHLKTQL